MLMGMLYTDILCPYRPNNSFPERVVLVGMARIVSIHISVGFCVARSDCVGNARASIRGTSNEHRLPRFFVYRKSHLLSPKMGKINLEKLMEHTGIIIKRDWLFYNKLLKMLNPGSL